MILGKVIGKTSTKQFAFKVEGSAHIFEYVQVMHSSGEFILAQIEEIEKDSERSVAFCSVIGYRDDEGKLQSLKYPLDPGVEVLRADDDFIQDILGLEKKKHSAYIGILDGREHVKVYLDMHKVLSKHAVILAKSGSGKSYVSSVLLEELLLKKIPVVVIDPHGEYPSLKYPNPKDKENMLRFGIEAQGFLKQIQEFSPDIKVNSDAKPLKLSNRNLTSAELIHLLPTKISSSQLGLVYGALKNLGGQVDFNEMMIELEASEDNPSKWTLIHIFEYVKKLNLFSENPTLMGELVQSGKMSIINLRGVAQDIQEVIVYKLVHDLFEERKKNTIPPFFLIIEECHTFCPERNFGEAKSSAIIRQVAAEGRKFGLGLCLITQRPSRIDKSCISQASTQIILKVTNPHDIKAIAHSLEGITVHTEKEIQNIPIGTALVTGIVDLPLLVNIRPRMSKHGGEAVSAFLEDEEEEKKEEETFVVQEQKFEEEGEMLPLIKQQFSKDDVKLMHGNGARVSLQLVPGVLMRCAKNGEEFSILIDLVDLQVIEKLEMVSGLSLLKLHLEELNFKQEELLNIALKQGREMKATELFAKSGMQFTDFYQGMDVLVRKGYLTRVGNDYTLSSSLEFLATIDTKQCYYPLVYGRSSGEKVVAKYPYQIIKDFLHKFFDVKDVKECWIEKYSVC